MRWDLAARQPEPRGPAVAAALGVRRLEDPGLVVGPVAVHRPHARRGVEQQHEVAAVLRDLGDLALGLEERARDDGDREDAQAPSTMRQPRETFCRSRR
jgi:hypothetical protein